MMNYSRMIKPYPHQELSHSIYRPAYHRIPSTGLSHKESISEMSSPIVVPSMPNTGYDQSYGYMYYKQISYQPIMHVPIHHTLENATITYDTRIEHQKDLVKDVFFSPAMNDREMSPTPSISSTQSDDECSLSPSELLPLEEENLFDFGLEILDKKPSTESNSNKRRWSESVLDQNKRQKLQNPYKRPMLYFEEVSDKEDSDEETYGNTVEFQPFEDDASSVDSWEESEEEYKIYAKKQQKQKKIETIQQEEYSHLPKAEPRPTAQPTLYQKLTKANVDWCRYCGTTEGVNWRPGPWGKRTLCNKHGCDYKGYGFACKLPRLDLTGFTKETIDQRDRPVLQLYCSGCQRKDSWEGNVLVRCEGCPKAYHQKCCANELSDEWVASDEPWFCDESCCENSKRKRIVVELPRKRLPLMCAPSKSNLIESKRHSIPK
ncbi:hypothetical protein G6F56_005219 [Rhizopus delemar]|uniref:Zinc finger PHD-type domain-containing protein n=1 Tax=Rhizopus stolonifer TaxID=4846 RepID=A0A367JGU1_RHIST|nr:hypothetical protein G6F56_005219 [Rhizopus delemar]RCH89168.1 hypothetical protein CU098_007514 [Rhizopus stolonifer]